jgi:uncharacterized OB-fold protein
VLIAQVCDACGAQYFDRRNACRHCGQRTFHATELPRAGRIRSFTIVHRAAPGVLRGEAGDRQLPDAKVGLTHVIGLGSACAVHILERAA